MQIAKVLSTKIKTTRAKKEILAVTAQIRKGQNITAEYISSAGDASTPVIGDYVVLTPRGQSIGGFLAFGFVDVLNALFADRGAKILYGRDKDGVAKTKISLTDKEIIIENPSTARIVLEGGDIILNAGEGSATENGRLQQALQAFSSVLVAEFAKVAAGTLPNPAAPYIPSPNLPVDVSPAQSQTIKIP